MNLIEHLEETYGEHAELTAALVAVEVRYPDEEDVNHMHTTVEWHDNWTTPSGRLGMMVHIVRGLL